MVKHLSQTLYHTGLAILAAVAVVFPSPRAAIDAVDRVVFPSSIQFKKRENFDALIVVKLQQTPLISVLEHPTLVECLLRPESNQPLEQMKLCAARISSGMPPIGDPQTISLTYLDQREYASVEDKRLALAKLCRLIWVEAGGQPGSLGVQGCEGFQPGLEQVLNIE